MKPIRRGEIWLKWAKYKEDSRNDFRISDAEIEYAPSTKSANIQDKCFDEQVDGNIEQNFQQRRLTESRNSEPGKPKRCPKRGKKRPPDEKKSYNENKLYFAAKGKEIAARSFNQEFRCECKQNCTDIVVTKEKINQNPVDVALTKYFSNMIICDGRGLEIGGKNRCTDKQIETIIHHINSFPKYISHYCRNKTNSNFLNPHLNLTKMYDLYQTCCDNGKSLSADKLEDLKEISKLVPADAKWFLYLSKSAEFKDDVDGFGSSVNFESGEENKESLHP
ncbi:hypothetical protein ILUMI_27063, partial [Ignelater luminosus]